MNAPLSFFDRRPFFTLLTVLGSLFIVLTGFLFLGFGALTGHPEESLPFALIFIVPSLLSALLVWRFGRLTHLLAVLVALAFLGLFAPILPFNLSHPEAGFEFILVVVFLIGALMAIVGGVASVVQWRRKSARPGASPAQRRAVQAILGLTVIIALASGLLSLAARSTVSAEARANALELHQANTKFVPARLQVKAGETVHLVVYNEDAMLHTFTLPEAGVDTSVPPGAQKLIEFKAPAPGTYTFYCYPHSSVQNGVRSGMVGTIVVQ